MAAKRYAVHKQLLCDSSCNFQAAFNHQWKETKENQLVLADVDPLVFEVYVDWLYKGSIVTSNTFDPNFLLQTYVFADCYLIPQFKRDVIDRIKLHLEVGRLSVKPDQISFLLDNLPKSSPIFDMLVDHFIRCHGNWVSSETQLAKYPLEFTAKWCFRMVSLVSFSPSDTRTVWTPKLDNPCNYHEHENKKSESLCLEKRNRRLEGQNGG